MNRDPSSPPAALITVDGAGHIAAWDAVMPSALGWTEELVLDARVVNLIDAGAARHEFDDWLTALARTPAHVASDSALTTAFLTRDGSVVRGVVHCEPSCLCPDTRFLFVYLAQTAPDSRPHHVGAPRWDSHPSRPPHRHHIGTPIHPARCTENRP